MAGIISDESIREALKSVYLGEIKRETYYNEKEDNTIPQFKNISAGAKYIIGEEILVRSEAVIGHKLVNEEKTGVVSLNDFLSYKSECESFDRRFKVKRDEENALAQTTYDKELAIWEQKYPNYDPVKSLKTGNFSIAAFEKPKLELDNFKRVTAYRSLNPAHGILVFGYDDKECFTMEHSKITISYLPREFRIDECSYKDVLSAPDFREIISGLEAKFNVKSIHDGSTSVGLGGRLSIRSSNFFAKEFTSKNFTPDEFIESVNNVYQAGTQFKNGIQSLRDEIKRKADEEKRRKLGAFKL